MKKLILLLSIVLSGTVLSAQNEEYIKTYHQYLKESQILESIDSTFSKIFSIYRQSIPKEEIPTRIWNKMYKKMKILYISVYQDSLLSTYYQNFSLKDLQDMIDLYRKDEMKIFIKNEPKVCSEMASQIAVLQMSNLNSFKDSISIWKQMENHEKIFIYGSNVDSIYKKEVKEYLFKIGDIEEILVNSLKIVPRSEDVYFDEKEIKQFIPFFIDHTIYPIYRKYISYDSFHHFCLFFKKPEHKHFPTALKNIYKRTLVVSYQAGKNLGKEIYNDIRREGYTISVDVPY